MQDEGQLKFQNNALSHSHGPISNDWRYFLDPHKFSLDTSFKGYYLISVSAGFFLDVTLCVKKYEYNKECRVMHGCSALSLTPHPFHNRIIPYAS
jgi:hypothetical protein